MAGKARPSYWAQSIPGASITGGGKGREGGGTGEDKGEGEGETWGDR